MAAGEALAEVREGPPYRLNFEDHSNFGLRFRDENGNLFAEYLFVLRKDRGLSFEEANRVILRFAQTVRSQIRGNDHGTG